MRFVLLRFELMNESSCIIRHTEGRRGWSKANATKVPRAQRATGGVAYRFLITFEINVLDITPLIKSANYLCCSLCRRHLRDIYCLVY